MAKEIQEWQCDGEVSYEYFKSEGFCTTEHIEKALRQILLDYPEFNIYIGITHNPCGRWTLNYNKTLPPAFRRNETVVEGYASLTEAAHKDEYDKMFVICYYDNEAKIRKTEEISITIAKEIDSERVDNITKGQNGYLAEDAAFYFLYVCISKISILRS